VLRNGNVVYAARCGGFEQDEEFTGLHVASAILRVGSFLGIPETGKFSSQFIQVLNKLDGI
jgi:hypothetical protein